MDLTSWEASFLPIPIYESISPFNENLRFSWLGAVKRPYPHHMLGCVLIVTDGFLSERILAMSYLFISVGIDVGADFSYMSIVLPNQTLVGKPFKITHANLNSLEKAVLIIKEAKELHSLKTRIIMESTGYYHYTLFCYLRDKGLCVHIINPIISKNSTNINIRKVHNAVINSGINLCCI